MKISSRIPVVLAVVVAIFAMSSVCAQTGGVKPYITGDVTSVETGKIVLQTKDGSINVVLSDKTEYKRVPPENPSLKAAVAAAFSDIGTGDKLVVTGLFSDDKKTLSGHSVYLMTKSDITKRNERWTTRGISGRVVSVDQTTGQIKIEIKGLLNSTNVVLTPKANATFKRYAPNSVKFSEATASSIADIQAGDGLRAVGDKSADGASFAAEEIVSGAFRTVAGTVKTVDVAKNEVVITEAQSKKDVAIDLGSATVMKKFPEEMAQRMASFQGGGPGGARPGGGPPAGGAGAARPQGARPGAGGQPGQGGPGGARNSIDDMLERFPNITAADLKTGEVIAIVTSKNGAPDRMTAFKLLAGVEPFLRAAQAQAAASGGQRGQGTLSLDIPGLDGFGGP